MINKPFPNYSDEKKAMSLFYRYLSIATGVILAIGFILFHVHPATIVAPWLILQVCVFHIYMEDTGEGYAKLQQIPMLHFPFNKYERIFIGLLGPLAHMLWACWDIILARMKSDESVYYTQKRKKEWIERHPLGDELKRAIDRLHEATQKRRKGVFTDTEVVEAQENFDQIAKLQPYQTRVEEISEDENRQRLEFTERVRSSSAYIKGIEVELGLGPPPKKSPPYGVSGKHG